MAGESPTSGTTLRVPPINESDNDSSQVEDKGYVKTTWRQYCSHAAFGVYTFVFGLSSLVTAQFIYDRIAEFHPGHGNVTHSRSRCDDNTSQSDLEIVVDTQEATSRLILFLTLTTGVTCSVTVIFLGSISDRYGRRMLYALPNTGLLLKMIIYAITSELVLPLKVLYAAHFVDGLSGFFVTLLVGASSTASDTTSTYKSRTIQMTIVNVIVSVGIGLSAMSTGYMITSYGYAVSSYVAAGILALNFFLIYAMTETISPNVDPKNVLSYVKTLFQFYYTKDESNKRTRYITIIVIFSMVNLVLVGRGAIDTLYLLNEPFCWNPVEIGFNAGILALVNPIPAMLTLIPLQRILSDSGIAAVGCVIAASGFAIMGVANSTVILYLGAALSSLAVVESLAYVTGGVLFNGVYEATLASYRGFVYFVMAGIMVASAIAHMALSRLLKRTTITLTVAAITNEQERGLHSCTSSGIE